MSSVCRSTISTLCHVYVSYYILHEYIRAAVILLCIACECNEDGIIDDGQCDDVVSNIM